MQLLIFTTAYDLRRAAGMRWHPAGGRLGEERGDPAPAGRRNARPAPAAGHDPHRAVESGPHA